jgi:RHS repeat-associated protein
MVFSGGSFSNYEYYIKDHLGNIRVVFKNTSNTPEILQKNDYYPFGLLMAERTDIATNKNRYLYNGKENIPDAKMALYDYGARFYDPQIGRWTVIDGKAEKYTRFSPYAYAINNPVRFLDPDGNQIVDAKGVPITYSTEKGWSSNVTADVRRIGNAMMVTPKGTEMFNKMMNANYNITITIDPGKGDGSRMGYTSSTKSGDNIGKADIVIYEGMAQEKFSKLKDAREQLDKGAKFSKDPGEKNKALLDNMPKNADEMMSYTAVHEGEHATDKNANPNFEPDKNKQEDLANEKQIEVIKQTPEYRLEMLEPKKATVSATN